MSNARCAVALGVLLLAPPSTADPVLRASTPADQSAYAWLASGQRFRSLDETFPPPEAFTRVKVQDGSFGRWLRRLPLRGAGTPVLSHDGRVLRAADDSGIAAVATLDVGSLNLQQCADSILRLHAEWLWAGGRRAEIAYHFTSGHLASWSAWSAGERPTVHGSKVSWTKTAPADASRRAFRAYLDAVFTYAGTLSLEAHGEPVNRRDAQPGDYFVQGGSPGHAVIILDVASAPDGRRVALIGEGYSPAQDFHVTTAPDSSAWYPLETEEIVTPYWLRPFRWSDLRRFATR